jgi:8-oxo-dGTP diphosphatase
MVGTNDTHEVVRLTADVVVLAGPASTPPTDHQVLLIRRGWPPFAGMWALPGGHVDPGETTLMAARRELSEETGLALATLGVSRTDMIEVGTFSQPGRDPRGRYVSVAYLALLPEPVTVQAGDDATTAAWFPLHDVLSGPRQCACGVMLLAFDHTQIVTRAVSLLRSEGGGP